MFVALVKSLPFLTSRAPCTCQAPCSILPLMLDRACLDAGGRRRLHDITLRLDAGPRTIILGPNGAGKSLLLRLCHGLLPPSAGTVTWLGTDATATSSQIRARQAMVFQRPVMLRRSTAANIDHALRLRGLCAARRRERTAQALMRTGLGELADRPARVLSGGEQQRLALARAWALAPDVLFLDEPTAALDPAATRAIEAIIGAVAAEGTKIVMTTHDLPQARRLADDIVFVHQGRLIEHSPADRFFAEPDSAEARAFLAGELLW